MTTYDILHCKADIDRLYLPRTNGGCGMKQIESAQNITILTVGQYIQEKGGNISVAQAILAH